MQHIMYLSIQINFKLFWQINQKVCEETKHF